MTREDIQLPEDRSGDSSDVPISQGMRNITCHH